MFRTYSELITFKTFEERFNYLKLDGSVGIATFGYDRIFNQMFYTSKEWKQCRNFVIARDCGRDLGIDGREIHNGVKIFIHHLNAITLDDIKRSTDALLNPEFLITCTLDTHNAIHYGDEKLLVKEPITRTKYDTCPWRH